MQLGNNLCYLPVLQAPILFSIRFTFVKNNDKELRK